MAEILVIGKGPAGISAAVYAVRAGASVTVIGKDNTSLKRAHKIDNYYGFSGISGEELFERGISQAKGLGVRFIEDESVGIGYGEGEDLTVDTVSNGTITAGAVIIATGASRPVPRIEGIKEFEGKGVSYCAVCDGFFFRGRKIAVIGNGEYAAHEATVLADLASEVTIFTDGMEMEAGLPLGVKVNKEKIKKITGNEAVEKIETETAEYDINGVFVALGVAGSADLARKMGARTEGNRISVNTKMETDVPGLYAAGDCTGGMMQIVKSAYEGAVAGSEAAKYLKALK